MTIKDCDTGRNITKDNILVKLFSFIKVRTVKFLSFLAGKTIPSVLFRVYFIIVIIGALILASPISLQNNRNGFTNISGDYNFFNALFIACSGFSTTGLTTNNIYETFTTFGQITLLILIQLGGLGVMTIFYCTINMIGKIFCRKDILNINNIKLLQAERGGNNIVDTIKAVSTALATFIIIEIIFAFAMSFCFYSIKSYTQIQNDSVIISYDDPTKSLGLYHNYSKSLWTACFTTIASICNAGFDNISSSSLSPFRNDWGTGIQILIVIELIIGAIGHFTIYDVIQKIKSKFTKQKYHLTIFSKLGIITYFVLLFITIFSCLMFEFFGTKDSLIISNSNANREFGNNVMYNKVFSIIFNSLNTRSLGSYSINPLVLNEDSIWVYNIMMQIGGSPCSTAGGIRTTTIAIIFLTIFAKISGHRNVTFNKKTIPLSNVVDSYITFFISLFLMMIGVLIVYTAIPKNSLTNLTFSHIFFENASAFGGCGLSMGITQKIYWWGLLYLIFLMFVGQLNIIVLLLSWTRKNYKDDGIEYSSEEIKIC